jgi:hypothetical protein
MFELHVQVTLHGKNIMSDIHENNESIQNSEANNQNSEPQAMEVANASLEAGVDRLVEIIDRTVPLLPIFQTLQLLQVQIEFSESNIIL